MTSPRSTSPPPAPVAPPETPITHRSLSLLSSLRKNPDQDEAFLELFKTNYSFHYEAGLQQPAAKTGFNKKQPSFSTNFPRIQH